VSVRCSSDDLIADAVNVEPYRWRSGSSPDGVTSRLVVPGYDTGRPPLLGRIRAGEAARCALL